MLVVAFREVTKDLWAPNPPDVTFERETGLSTHGGRTVSDELESLDQPAEGSRTDGQRVRIDRRAVLKGAAAAGVAGAAWAAPVVRSVPAFATAPVSPAPGGGPLPGPVTAVSAVQCVWFSPNQATFGQWHFGTATGAGTCYPPSIEVGVVVNGVTRYVRFAGIPDDWIGTTTTPCTSNGSTVPNYAFTNGTTPWSGGGVHISMLSAGCDIKVFGTYGGVTLGTYCNSGCDETNDAGQVPANWSQGSSTTPIGSPITPGTQPTGNVGNGVFTSAYYHSGQQGRSASPQCAWNLHFVVQAH